MLIHKNKALQLGLIATAIFGMSLASCSDDDDAKVLRRKEITLRTATEVEGGQVIIQERTDSSFDLTVKINKSTKDINYKFTVIKGDTGLLRTTNPTLEVGLDLGNETSTTTGAAVTKTIRVWKIKPATGDSVRFNYDSLLKYNYFARVNYVTAAPVVDSTVARANIGK
ncbi:hypothetical protein GFS24_16555 [Chitinophaga sp. SYP-B3965]|uniref:hypothetical protein n=1 Tax=Chitinophaga sp. SYP-B3965 TaxID=2663120 RepID=UPI001299B86F|nr:hypothetical protein [Chitinophaga sp. SYP-B3965]MRG46733.1 hypothetical protein [Chitinophaga sp. SYP-B3965]